MPASSLKHTTGFGDMQILGLAGPNRGEGLIWGAGATLKLPTAGSGCLGQGKYQAGPAAMLRLIPRTKTIAASSQAFHPLG